MKRILVGGPLLGQRDAPLDQKHQNESTSSDSWKTFEPLISPKIGTAASGKTERFVLLPNARFVTVLAYKTGKRVGTLLLSAGKEATGIDSLTLATFPKKSRPVQDLLAKTTTSAEEDVDEHVLLVGCQDGTVHEFLLSNLLSSPVATLNSNDCGPYQVSGPCYRPRRVIRVASEDHSVKHLTAPALPASTEDGIVVFAVAEEKRSVNSSKADATLLRLILPRFTTSSGTANKNPIDLRSLDSVPRVKVLDKLKYRLGEQKKKKLVKASPFSLIAVVRKRGRESGGTNGDNGVLLVMARPMSMTVYYERLSDMTTHTKKESKFVPVVFSLAKNSLTAVTVSSNGNDVACGHRSGEIRVMTNALGLVVDYHAAMDRFNQQAGPKGTSTVERPKHPSQQVITRKLHWHSHPVATLAYDGSSSSAEPMLYSGGNESVLLTWQLSRGTYKPADVLPRIALGGIMHILGVEQTGEPNGILVYCSDNSMQLFESHNRSLLWKVQGLAAGQTQEILPSYPTLTADPQSSGRQSSQMILTGLSHAPGYVHWYDPSTQQVTKSLEVAPYNRVSRTDPGDSPMPSPTITHCAWSKTGDDLMTVDTVPTENACMGALQRLPNGSPVGVISTLRFWSVPKEGKSHVLTAAMTYPHNSDNMVSATALSLDGKVACTVSNDEKAFRLWRKVMSQDEEKNGRRSPAWECRYKITTPAGYSNFATGRSGVAFSSDASTLAISFGHMVTLWDHREMTLLTSLRHIDNDLAAIESITFLDTKRLPDMLLTRSSTGVSLQSPYGSRGPTNLGWTWTIPGSAKNLSVCHAEFLPVNDVVAIAIYNQKTDSCRIVWIHAVTGEPVAVHDAIQIVDNIPGKILSVAAVGKSPRKSNWTRTESIDTPPTRLCVLTAKGEMILLDTQVADLLEPGLEATTMVGSTVPAVPVLSVRAGNIRKRPREVLRAEDLGDDSGNKRLSLDNFGGVTGEGSASSNLASELPHLRGSFARAFVARNLRRVGN
jgi:WD40 repeat protein